MTSDLDI